jgi:hypothetical protein
LQPWILLKKLKKVFQLENGLEHCTFAQNLDALGKLALVQPQPELRQKLSICAGTESCFKKSLEFGNSGSNENARINRFPVSK